MQLNLSERRARDGAREPNGFALIEVLMAMVIFTVGILALAGLQVTTISCNAAARMQTEATAIGARVVERLRLLPPGHGDLAATVRPHTQPPSIGRHYAVAWTVKADTPEIGTRTVRVTVTPVNKVNGRPLRISTIIAK
ncbi:MAG: prepilin-type N-terminal cleavage/methylation domain-containing protein [Desulfobacterales bacterium]